VPLSCRWEQAGEAVVALIKSLMAWCVAAVARLCQYFYLGAEQAEPLEGVLL